MKHWKQTLLCLALLAGCGTASDENSQIGLVRSVLSSQAAQPRFTALLQSGAPVLQVAFVRTQQGTNILLEHQRGDFEYWLASEGAQVILQKGMLHGIRGLGDGLLASELSQPMAHVFGLKSGFSDRFHTYLNGNDEAVTRTYRCQVNVGDKAPITLASKTISTRLVTESCRSLDQEFTNLYWVDPKQRRIVQSRQWIGPRSGYISTRVTH
ncbi:YjbF family lipoprotein [Planktotalea sp.]|uniref:YjbF family lipoprotein n=1 Tax=Planktotalea sp. TaxID=2029877 RepID=UPI003299BFA0